MSPPVRQIKSTTSAQQPKPSSPPIRQRKSTVSAQLSIASADIGHISPVVQKRPIVIVPTTEQSFSVLPKKPASPGVEKQHITPPSYATPLANTNTLTAVGLQKAPMVRLNYVVRSSDNKSMHISGRGDITIMQGTSSLPTTSYGDHRWYDHDYSNNVPPTIVRTFKV